MNYNHATTVMASLSVSRMSQTDWQGKHGRLPPTAQQKIFIFFLHFLFFSCISCWQMFAMCHGHWKPQWNTYTYPIYTYIYIHTSFAYNMCICLFVYLWLPRSFRRHVKQQQQQQNCKAKVTFYSDWLEVWSCDGTDATTIKKKRHKPLCTNKIW